MLGDEGSGYDIGRRAAILCARMSDGRADADDEFMNAVLGHYGIERGHERALIRITLGDDGRRAAASCAGIVGELCERGNKNAAALFESAADEIALAVRSVIRRYNGAPIKLAMSGGLLSGRRPLGLMLRERLYGESGISAVINPSLDAEIYAAALALDRGGCRSGARRLLGDAT